MKKMEEGREVLDGYLDKFGHCWHTIVATSAPVRENCCWCGATRFPEYQVVSIPLAGVHGNRVTGMAEYIIEEAYRANDNWWIQPCRGFTERVARLVAQDPPTEIKRSQTSLGTHYAIRGSSGHLLWEVDERFGAEYAIILKRVGRVGGFDQELHLGTLVEAFMFVGALDLPLTDSDGHVFPGAFGRQLIQQSQLL